MTWILFCVLWTLGGRWLGLRYPIKNLRSMSVPAVLAFIAACGPAIWVAMLAVIISDSSGNR